MKSARSRFSAKRYLRNKDGNFAIHFGLAATFIFLAGGLAVDYTMALGTKVRINNALDSASLATGRALAIGEIPSTGDAAENYFKAVFAANVGDDAFDSTTYTLKNFNLDMAAKTVSAEVEVDQKLTLARVRTLDADQTVASFSAASFGIGAVEVAMVLDVTGSMGNGYGSKLSNLKAAATLAVTELLDANTPTDENIRISLVPYAYGVNAGPLANYVYPDYRESKSDAPVYDPSFPAGYNVDAFQAPYKTNCYWVQNRVSPPAFDYAGFDGTSGMPKPINASFNLGTGADAPLFEPRYQLASHGGYSGTYTCFLPNDFRVNSDGTNVDDCATDRKAPKTSGLPNYQYTDENPSKGMISRDSRLYKNYCPSAPLVTLTSNETTLTSAISGLTGSGYTAGHIGLQWAWYTISPKWVDYIPGTASDPGDMAIDDDLAKFIILMTDGIFNTAYAGTNSSYVTSQPSLSEFHTDKLCDNIKGQGIKIFTIGYATPSYADAMLEDCASPDEGTFTYSYEPNTANELKSTFQTIANMIRTLRLSK